MTRYCKICNYSPHDLLVKAINHFGPRGLGMSVKEQVNGDDECCASLSDDKCYVYIKACKNDKGTELEMQSCKCDEQVKGFIEWI